MTQPNPPDQSTVFGEIASGLTAGMPEFRQVKIEFNGAADLRKWAARAGIEIPDIEGQPYPNPGLVDPSKATEWLISTHQTWHGLRVHLTSTDPITDEQRKYWVESGWAARMAAHEAKAAEPEPVDGGELVDETPAPRLVCAYETGGGGVLRRRCGAPIWWLDGSWRHEGALLDHRATPGTPRCTPACDAISTDGAPTGEARTWHAEDCPWGPILDAREQQRRAERVDGDLHFFKDVDANTMMCGLRWEQLPAGAGYTSGRDHVTCEGCRTALAARAACPPECEDRPAEWPFCLTDCPARRAAEAR